MKYLAGIDLGTSSVKVLITDSEGGTKGIGQVSYDIFMPKTGYAEHDPEIWWKSTIQAIRQAIMKSSINSKDIVCIGFSGQMHGLVAVNKAGKVVCPAIIWMDQRSVIERDEICEIAGDLINSELLNQPSAGMLICSLIWLKKNQPDVYKEINRIMLPKDYIRFRITGTIETDYSDASATLAFSVHSRQWCKELFKRLDVKDDIWPYVGAPYEVIGQVQKSAADVTGLSEQTKVVLGGGDAAMQLIGNGVVEEGIVSCNIGTSSQIATVVHKPAYDPLMRCQTWCHAIQDTWYIQGGTLNGGSAINWLKQKVLRDSRNFTDLDREAGKIHAGSEGLIFIPFLAGERTPFMDPKARGIYFGLTMRHDQNHIIRATMEGVIYNLKECEKIFNEIGMKKKKIISSGGGARGKTWRQIQADMFELPVYTTQTEEEACLGAVIVAAVGIGLYSSIQEACKKIVKVNASPTEPIEENFKIYESMQETFREVYLRTNNLFSK